MSSSLSFSFRMGPLRTGDRPSVRCFVEDEGGREEKYDDLVSVFLLATRVRADEVEGGGRVDEDEDGRNVEDVEGAFDVVLDGGGRCTGAGGEGSRGGGARGGGLGGGGGGACACACASGSGLGRLDGEGSARAISETQAMCSPKSNSKSPHKVDVLRCLSIFR